MSADKSPMGFQPSSRITGSLVTPAKPVFTAKSAVTICICLKSFFLPSRHIDHEAAKINEATQMFFAKLSCWETFAATCWFQFNILLLVATTADSA